MNDRLKDFKSEKEIKKMLDELFNINTVPTFFAAETRRRLRDAERLQIVTNLERRLSRVQRALSFFNEDIERAASPQPTSF